MQLLIPPDGRDFVAGRTALVRSQNSRRRVMLDSPSSGHWSQLALKGQHGRLYLSWMADPLAFADSREAVLVSSSRACRFPEHQFR